MPQYELEMNGKSYEVEAPSMEAAVGALKPWQMDWGSGQQAAPSGQMPWERDWSGAGQQQPQQQGDFLHPVKPAAGSGMQGVWERVKQYPGLIAGHVLDALSLPGEVYQGKIDPYSPEARERELDLASMIVNPSAGAGMGAQIARRAGMSDIKPGMPNPDFAPAAVSPNLQAAQTAADIGAPLPRGVVSESPVYQATTQALRNLPLVGPQIDERIRGTIRAAGGRVGQISEDLAGGAPDRAAVGTNLRPSLEGVIESNNDAIDSAYDTLRQVTDPNKFGSLPRTRAAYEGIVRQRRGSGMTNPGAGLDDINNLLTSGRSLNGLIRARSDVGKSLRLSASNPNPGFSTGDFKRLYAAMTGDMEGIVRQHSYINPDDAAAVLKEAHGTAAELINANKIIQNLLNNPSNERMVGSVINAAQNRTGNARLLYQLRQQMPPEDFQQIAGVGLHELGYNPATDAFSLDRFSTNWNKLSDTSKKILFDEPSHRRALDDIANMGKVLKNASRYENASKTSHTGTFAIGLGLLGEAAAEGDIHRVLGALGGLGAGYALGKILTRPAGAKVVSRWIRDAQAFSLQRNTRTNLALSGSTRALLTHASSVPGFDPSSFANSLATSADSQPDQGQVPIPRPRPRQPLHITVHPKMQDRMPAPAY